MNGERSSESAEGSPTRIAILDVAIRLLEERGPDGVTVDEVLLESSTSASSLYHHFGNREGLLLAAQAARYRRMLIGEDRGNLAGGHGAQTTEEFLDYVAGQLRRIVTDPASRDVRRNRLQVTARSLTSPELAAETRRLRDLMLEAIGEMFDDAKARGLINADLDVPAYCAWFHGMTLGRTFTEDGFIDADAWLAIAIPAAFAPLLPSATSSDPASTST